MRILPLVLLLATAACATARPAAVVSPANAELEALIDAQVEAYNRKDIDAFVGYYATDARIYAGTDSLMMDGAAAIRAEYGAFFREAPAVRVVIGKRMVQGNYVVDQEHVSGFPDAVVRTAVAIYEVRAGRIQNVWLLQ